MLQEKMDKLMLEFAVKVEKCILKKDYEKVSKNEYTISIKCMGEKLEIWDRNEPHDCHCFRFQTTYRKYTYFPPHRFLNPEKCRDILREESPSEKEERMRGIDKEIARLKLEREG